MFDFGFYLSTKIIDHTSDRILVNSELVKKKFQRNIDSKKFSIVNYNIPAPGIDKRVLSFSATSFDLLLIGQVKVSKGQMEAVCALEILLKEKYDVRLLVIGQVTDHEYYNQLQQYIQSKNLNGHIQFISHTLHPFSEVSKFTIGLMCSELEALGRVTVEYMKAGIPVVGADAGSTTMLLDSNRNGLLYEKGNYVQLAEKIKELVSDERLVEKLTHSAREFAESNFNERRFVDGITASLN